MYNKQGLTYKILGVLIGILSIVSFVNPDNWPINLVIIVSFGIIIYGIGILISKEKQ